MLIQRKSLMSGVIRTLDMPVTEEQLELWESGMKIQEAMPDLSAAQREFILTGSTSDEWDEAFYDEDDELDLFSD